jgi:hypothetical protein
MSTSVAYLRKRLADIGRHDLLAAVDRGDISAFAAAEAAGLITTARSRVTGNGSGNQARRRHWAVLRATGQAPPLPHTEPQPAGPVSPLPQEIADIVRKLVAADRADLIIAVAERRLTPFQAAAIADRDVPPQRTARAKADKAEKVEKTQPKKPAWDVEAMIG